MFVKLSRAQSQPSPTLNEAQGKLNKLKLLCTIDPRLGLGNSPSPLYPMALRPTLLLLGAIAAPAFAALPHILYVLVGDITRTNTTTDSVGLVTMVTHIDTENCRLMTMVGQMLVTTVIHPLRRWLHLRSMVRGAKLQFPFVARL